jgi:flavin reductase (DIM6/NTAB) family NADH-FMN oxidoreductase RutF
MIDPAVKHPLIAASGVFSVSILAADQIDAGQYFSYPGRRFRHIANDYLEMIDDLPVVRDCVARLRCDVFDRMPMRVEGYDIVPYERDDEV